MLKKILIAGVLLLLAAGGGCYMFVTGLMDTGNKELTALFEDFEKLPDAELQERFVPELMAEPKRERVLAFARALPATFGAYREIPFMQGNLNINAGTGGRVFRYSGVLEFEKGPHKLEVITHDRKVQRLKLLDEADVRLVEATMSKAPSDPTAYRPLARGFLEAWVAGRRDEAFAKLLPAAAQEWGKQGLDAKLQELGLAGASGPVEPAGDFDPGRPDALGMRFRVGGNPVDVLVGFAGFHVGVLEVTGGS